MASENKDRGYLARVEVVRPDGRTQLLSLRFPGTFDGKRWMAINVCECGESIHYDWDDNHTFRKAVCPACGIIFVIKETI